MRRSALIAACVLAGCGLTPLSNKIDIGEMALVAFVAEGKDGNTDLFILPAAGGEAAQLTFSPPIEAAPRLGPDGSVVAFLRMRDTLPGTPRDVVMMSLVNGAERRVRLPADAGPALAIGWSDDGRALFVRTGTTAWRVAVPPADPAPERLDGAAAATADSVLDRWLGRPRFARAFACAADVCVRGPSGDTAVLAANARDPFPWGSDSVGWFEGERLMVRSLGPGPARRLTWSRIPGHPRDASYSPAPVTSAP